MTLVFVGAALVSFLMFSLWVVHLQLKNAGVVDIGWACGLGILALVDASLGTGDLTRRWLLAGMVLIWSGRLGSHLFTRIVGHPEEGRYRQLRQTWGGNIALKFLAFFEAQALLDLILSIPILIVSLNAAPGLSGFEYTGIALWLVAIAGESLADRQLAAFKRAPGNKGKVCEAGLWRYSRHPNYFFEWLVWVAWALFAWNSPYGAVAILCPALMLFFLYRVTGIPATEAQALRSKGDAYRRYQETTSAFIPWVKSGG